MIYPRIRAMREDKDLTQADLGECLNISEKSYQYYENGKRGIPTEVLIKIAQFHNVSIDYLVGRTDNPEMNRS